MTSHSYTAPTPEILERRLRERDQPGKHLWVMGVAWGCDPERAAPGDTLFLDQENIIALGGAGCFKCEMVYSRKLAKRPCRGSVDDLQP